MKRMEGEGNPGRVRLRVGQQSLERPSSLYARRAFGSAPDQSPKELDG